MLGTAAVHTAMRVYLQQDDAPLLSDKKSIRGFRGWAGKGGSKEVLACSFWSRIRALTPVARAVAFWDSRAGHGHGVEQARPVAAIAHELHACFGQCSVQGSGGCWLAGDASAWCRVWSPGPTDGVVKRLHDMGEYLERGRWFPLWRRGEAAYPIRQHGAPAAGVAFAW